MPIRRPRFEWHDDVEADDLESFDRVALGLLRARAEKLHERAPFEPALGRIRESTIPYDDHRIVVLYVCCEDRAGVGVLFVRIVPRDEQTPEQAFAIAQSRLREMPKW